MILESLRVLLTGMAGIFFVMGLLVGTLTLMRRFSRKEEEAE
jgi:Na+-transporting methylmalonyl-CoA/oxaloacetate decarboxylase gamma subunit